MKEQIKLRIESLRQQMRYHGIDAVIIPQTDPHQSEYIADHWQVRRFLSGFTGSAGSLVVTLSEALLWVDSRYYLQGAQQLEGTEIVLMKDGMPGVPSINEYLVSVLKSGDTVGVDGMLFSPASVEVMRKAFTRNGISLVTDFDVIDDVWTDRPPLPKDEVFVHDEVYTGVSATEKLAGVLKEAEEYGADSVLVSALDEIAWALNIRSRDVKYNPVVTSYLFVDKEGATLFVDEDKISSAVRTYLESHGVSLAPYQSIKEFIAALPDDSKVLIEEAKTSEILCALLGSKAVKGFSPIAVAKACRNETQIEGFRRAMERDGVALVRAFKELEDRMADGERLTEMDFDGLLLKYRSAQDLFFDESFGSIVGYGPHGAIVHYEATPETDVVIEPHGLLLVDSGAQYLDGTTDITRTVAMGEPTEAEKHDFTLVMKGHIALDSMIFPVGTRGAQLDVEARKFLWAEGLAYMHGTGHGVGHFLNVHEGPQTIRLNDTPIPLMEGMVTSNEPGLYRENVHGVRCENLVLCVKAMDSDFGSFLKFEPLTLLPFDITLMETEIMSPEEIAWVNDYHRMVRERLNPYLTDEEREWLAVKTQPINK